MTGGVITFTSCKPSSDARKSLLCFQGVRFRVSSRTSLRNFATSCLFMLCRFGWKIYKTFAKRPNKLFRTALKEMTFALVGKRSEHFESRENLAVHRPKTLIASSVQRQKILNDWIYCLFSNVVDCLFVATSLSTIDNRVQALHLDTNLLVFNRDPFLHKACWLASHHEEIWREQRACSGAPPSLLWWNKLGLM